jgi:hypothetical protein
MLIEILGDGQLCNWERGQLDNGRQYSPLFCSAQHCSAMPGTVPQCPALFHTARHCSLVPGSIQLCPALLYSPRHYYLPARSIMIVPGTTRSSPALPSAGA